MCIVKPCIDKIYLSIKQHPCTLGRTSIPYGCGIYRTFPLPIHKVLRLPRNLHFKIHKALRLPRNTSRFTKCCACHEICTRFTKCCACHEICISRFTKCCACHEICMSRFTKRCACHEILRGSQSAAPAMKSALRGLQSAAPATKAALRSNITKNRLWTTKARGSPRAQEKTMSKNVHGTTTRAQLRQAPAAAKQTDFASLRSRNALNRLFREA